MRPYVIAWLLIAAILLMAYWLAWLADRNLVASDHTQQYVDFEQSFPLADAWLALTVVVAAIALWRRRPSASTWLAVAGGAGVYLCALDVLYDLGHDVYAKGGPGLVELAINLVTRVSSVGIISFSSRFRPQLLGASTER